MLVSGSGIAGWWRALDRRAVNLTSVGSYDDVSRFSLQTIALLEEGLLASCEALANLLASGGGFASGAVFVASRAVAALMGVV